MPALFSSGASNRSTCSKSHLVSPLPMLMPAKSGDTTAASSPAVSPVSSELTLTITRRPAARSLGTHAMASSHAAPFSPGGTESSRSTMTTSAPNPKARSSILARLPGNEDQTAQQFHRQKSPQE